MTRLLGNGEGHTVVILTDAESRLLRDVLSELVIEKRLGPPGERPHAALAAFNRGIARGTERVTAEFAELQKARKKT